MYYLNAIAKAHAHPHEHLVMSLLICFFKPPTTLSDSEEMYLKAQKCHCSLLSG